jgi:hypothetical protein
MAQLLDSWAYGSLLTTRCKIDFFTASDCSELAQANRAAAQTTKPRTPAAFQAQNLSYCCEERL